MMTVEITLHLSEQLIEQAKRFGEATHQEVSEVLASTLENLWQTNLNFPELAPPISSLNDEDVLALASLKMPVTQNDRLGELQQKGKRKSLSETERTELRALLHIYQMGQLRKSEGRAEAVRRGLRTPLSA
jgi:Arc/MetJ-type ribon-helix-helix transcriptional regulator